MLIKTKKIRNIIILLLFIFLAINYKSFNIENYDNYQNFQKYILWDQKIAKNLYENLVVKNVKKI